MVIRSLDNPNDRLSVMIDDQGDVYVTIAGSPDGHRLSTVQCVRIGSSASGHSLPPTIKKKLNELAWEFAKYKGCKNEAEAYDKWSKENPNYKPEER